MVVFKRDQLKTYVVVGAFLGLCCWVAVLQTRYESRIKQLEEEGSVRVKRSAGSSGQNAAGGATYIRWGRTVCPADAELVYAGYGGAQHPTNQNTPRRRLQGKPIGHGCTESNSKYPARTSLALLTLIRMGSMIPISDVQYAGIGFALAW
ncbi:uncharacterized protein LOC135487133 isoform X2 [Lineus longissimus]|uniref:uncharacterized protein LOC135487133 isoform X2 n=1 Tax=Lineus longissimus TaxID=88925 RepID=UPI00315D5FDA